jgi:hypothetical protein
MSHRFTHPPSKSSSNNFPSKEVSDVLTIVTTNEQTIESPIAQHQQWLIPIGHVRAFSVPSWHPIHVRHVMGNAGFELHPTRMSTAEAHSEARSAHPNGQWRRSRCVSTKLHRQIDRGITFFPKRSTVAPTKPDRVLASHGCIPTFPTFFSASAQTNRRNPGESTMGDFVEGGEIGLLVIRDTVGRDGVIHSNVTTGSSMLSDD